MPIEPEAQEPPEAIEPPLPSPAVGLAIEAASHALEVSRRYRAPRSWRCSKAQRERLAKAGQQKTLQALSDKKAEGRWETSELLRERVPHDVAYWRRIRWGYVHRGVCDPESFVTEGIIQTHFLDAPLKVNVAIAPLLARIEGRLATSQGGTPEFESISAFVARTVRGPFRASSKLSNHAFGLAIDIDPASNPYLSRKELQFIEKLTGVKIKRSTSIEAGARWDNFKKAEELYLARIGPWLQNKEAEIAKARRSRAGRSRLKRLQRDYDEISGNRNLMRAIDNGFLSHPRHFVLEMESSGFTWCTDFGPGADLMHYELRGQMP